MLPSMYRYGTIIFIGNHIYGFKVIAMIYLVCFLAINFPSTFLGDILKLFFMLGQVEAFSTTINKSVETV